MILTEKQVHVFYLKDVRLAVGKDMKDQQWILLETLHSHVLSVMDKGFEKACQLSRPDLKNTVEEKHYEQRKRCSEKKILSRLMFVIGDDGIAMNVRNHSCGNSGYISAHNLNEMRELPSWTDFAIKEVVICLGAHETSLVILDVIKSRSEGKGF